MKARGAGVETHQLALHPTGQRLAALRAERDRLVKAVAKKRSDVENAAETAQHAASNLLTKIAPLLQRRETACAETIALLDELLGRPQLSRRARKAVEAVRRTLIELGMLDTPSQQTVDDHARPDRVDGGEGLGDGAFGASNGVLDRPRAEGQNRPTLRGLFRRMALALHPDRAEDDPERARRTEAMKELTSAFEKGDLGRLLELERRWATGTSEVPPADEEQCCRELEQVNGELRAQLKDLNRELRRIRACVPVPAGMPIELVLAGAEAEIVLLETSCRFVRDFRDGKISLSQFEQGPEIEVDPSDVELDIAALSELFGAVVDGPSRPRARRTRSGQGAKGRASTKDTCPF